MDHNARIEAVITDLESQDRLNVAATAKGKSWVSRFCRRHQGQLFTVTFNASSQPLDVRLFSPLAIFYSQQVYELLAESSRTCTPYKT
jgi:hypothetical protein